MCPACKRSCYIRVDFMKCYRMVERYCNSSMHKYVTYLTLLRRWILGQSSYNHESNDVSLRAKMEGDDGKENIATVKSDESGWLTTRKRKKRQTGG